LNTTPLFQKRNKMNNNTNSFGNSVFGQLLSLLPKTQIASVISKFGANKYAKKFKTLDHLKVMLFAVFSYSGGLREIESGVAGFRTKLLHLGLEWLPKKSTLSDANAKRSADVFEAIFQTIYKHFKPYLPDSYPKNQEWMQKLFLVDSTTITLFKNILKACGRTPANGKRKGGVKIHVGMHLSESTPSLVRVTSAATNDKKFMTKFRDIEPGTILVFDKAYIHYELYNHWTNNQVIFVTRLNRRSTVKVIQEHCVNEAEEQQGVLEIKEVELGHPNQKQTVRCRLINFHDQDKEQHLTFITNDMNMSGSQIAEIYKQRWQIELLFKRLKQNLQLSDFLGDNENAVRIQIWCNLIADILLTVIRKGVKLKRAYSNVAGLVRLHLMNYVDVNKLLNNPGDIRIFENNQNEYMPETEITPPSLI
jgi:hypothetical protein